MAAPFWCVLDRIGLIYFSIKRTELQPGPSGVKSETKTTACLERSKSSMCLMIYQKYLNKLLLWEADRYLTRMIRLQWCWKRTTACIISNKSYFIHLLIWAWADQHLNTPFLTFILRCVLNLHYVRRVSMICWQCFEKAGISDIRRMTWRLMILSAFQLMSMKVFVQSILLACFWMIASGTILLTKQTSCLFRSSKQSQLGYYYSKIFKGN